MGIAKFHEKAAQLQLFLIDEFDWVGKPEYIHIILGKLCITFINLD